MKKLIAIFSTVFFVFALTGVNAWATDPKPENLPIDRHAVWTKIIEDHQKKDSADSQNKTAEASGEEHEKQTKMEVRMKDLPWQRIG